MITHLDDQIVTAGAAVRRGWWHLTGTTRITPVAAAVTATAGICGAIAIASGAVRHTGIATLVGVDPDVAHYAAAGIEVGWFTLIGGFIVHAATTADRNGNATGGGGGTAAADLHAWARRIVRVMLVALATLRLALAGTVGIWPAVGAAAAIGLFALALATIDTDPPSGIPARDRLRISARHTAPAAG